MATLQEVNTNVLWGLSEYTIMLIAERLGIKVQDDGDTKSEMINKIIYGISSDTYLMAVLKQYVGEDVYKQFENGRTGNYSS